MSEISIPDVMDGIIYLTEEIRPHVREGKKGPYIPIRVKFTPNNEYNDCMVLLRLPKELRDQGHKDPIIGNVSIPDWLKEQMKGGEQEAPAAQAQVQAAGATSGDLPF